MNALVVGSGGREHAICKKLFDSDKISKIFCIGISAGISEIAECVDIELYKEDNKSLCINEEIIEFIYDNNIDIIIIGPEKPLSIGIVDYLKSTINNKCKILGTNYISTKLESDKSFAKKLMKMLNIPTSDFIVFDNQKEAKKFVEFIDNELVIKASGLASGKGVFICKNKNEAIESINKLMNEKIFGSAGERIVIEKLLYGYELSLMCFIDGKNISQMPVVTDYKRISSKIGSKNTGGMGTSGIVKINDCLQNRIQNTILNPLINGFQDMNIDYRGILYVGLMIENNKPKVLEINTRFGDPECQAIMTLLETDLVDIIEAIDNQTLDKLDIKYRNKKIINVILSSQGYPEKYEIGKEIYGLDKKYNNVDIFHCGTKVKDNKIITNGGRVLCLTSASDTTENAIKNIYSIIGKDGIYFDGMYFRKDIGSR